MQLYRVEAIHILGGALVTYRTEHSSAKGYAESLVGVGWEVEVTDEEVPDNFAHLLIDRVLPQASRDELLEHIRRLPDLYKTNCLGDR